MPTANYAAELFEIFRKAAVERFELPMSDEQSAYRLRFRLNKLRVEMRKEQHFMLEIAESCSFIIEKDRPTVLICTPSDERYLKDIRNAIGEPSPEAIAAQEAMPATTRADHGPRVTSEQALESFFNATEKKEEPAP